MAVAAGVGGAGGGIDVLAVGGSAFFAGGEGFHAGGFVCTFFAPFLLLLCWR